MPTKADYLVAMSQARQGYLNGLIPPFEYVEMWIYWHKQAEAL